MAFDDIKDDGYGEQPLGQRLKVMTVLSVAPGTSGAPRPNRPIAIVSLGHKGEVEMPMMFLLGDVKKLAVGFLAALAHHGDETAEEIILKYYADKIDDEESFPPTPPPTRHATASGLKVQPDGPVLTATFYRLRANPVSFRIYAGYQFDKRFMLLARSVDFDQDMLVCVSKGKVRLKDHVTDEALPQVEWPTLLRRRAGSGVKVGKIVWAVMSKDDIRVLVDGQRFQIR